MAVNGLEHPKLRGQCSEAAIQFEFVKRGVTVLEPFGDNERYDLVIEIKGEFYRVQVKTGRLENGRVQFETRSTGSNTTAISKEGYDGEIDLFAVFSPESNQSFLVPIEDAPNTSMGIRVKDPEKRSPNVNHAGDYRFSEWLNKIT